MWPIPCVFYSVTSVSFIKVGKVGILTKLSAVRSVSISVASAFSKKRSMVKQATYIVQYVQHINLDSFKLQ